MDFWGGTKPKLIFFNIVMLRIKLKPMHAATYGSKYFATDTPSTLGVKSKGQTIFMPPILKELKGHIALKKLKEHIALKKLKGHIALGLSVCASVRLSVCFKFKIGF